MYQTPSYLLSEQFYAPSIMLVFLVLNGLFPSHELATQVHYSRDG